MYTKDVLYKVATGKSSMAEDDQVKKVQAADPKGSQEKPANPSVQSEPEKTPTVKKEGLDKSTVKNCNKVIKGVLEKNRISVHDSMNKYTNDEAFKVSMDDAIKNAGGPEGYFTRYYKTYTSQHAIADNIKTAQMDSMVAKALATQSKKVSSILQSNPEATFADVMKDEAVLSWVTKNLEKKGYTPEEIQDCTDHFKTMDSPVEYKDSNEFESDDPSIEVSPDQVDVVEDPPKSSEDASTEDTKITTQGTQADPSAVTDALTKLDINSYSDFNKKLKEIIQAVLATI